MFQLAELFGLLHVSEGDGKDRHIKVSKQTSLKDKIDSDTDHHNESGPDVKEHKETLNNNHKSHNKKTDTNKHFQSLQNTVCDDDLSTCDVCDKEIPRNNIELHKLRCIRNSASTSSATTARKTDTEPQNSVKPKKKKKTKSAKEKPAKQEEDFDALIQEAMQQNTVCNFIKCKAYTITLGQVCQFCRKCFCLTHHMPEVHGCGAEAKAHARAVINREGVLYRGSGVPDKKMDPNKRAHLQRKLDKKLTEMSDTRKIKKKGKDQS